MFLQYTDSGTLREYLKANFTRLQWADKLCNAKEIALGFLFLHDNNIIHRDLITDFRLSKQINEITSNSNVHGMPAYVEPQCLINDKYRRNVKSDVYSFGVILWEFQLEDHHSHPLNQYFRSLFIFLKEIEKNL
ncbi:kinase-like protein [Gigaspora margarita]|uniref:Kinase-like protein n=1 Tax=Gigaspora margarita TaxID=4874 RepID=A0A8H4ESP5_GIGMA|nr:kinase-like protein [Gigaspora margarita]